MPSGKKVLPDIEEIPNGYTATVYLVGDLVSSTLSTEFRLRRPAVFEGSCFLSKWVNYKIPFEVFEKIWDLLRCADLEYCDDGFCEPVEE